MPAISKLDMDIGRYAYREMKAFCLQYPEKKARAAAMLGAASPSMSGMPHGGGMSSPTERAAERREKLLADCDMIERCAKVASGGRFYAAIIENCCFGTSLDKISADLLPTSRRNEYYRARYEFFYILWNLRN